MTYRKPDTSTLKDENRASFWLTTSRPPSVIFTGVKYVEIWPNFGLWGTPAPKLSDVPDIMRVSMRDVCSHKIWYSSVISVPISDIFGRLSRPLNMSGKMCWISQLARRPRVKIYQSLGPRLNLEPLLRHLTYPPLIFKGVQNVRKCTKWSITQLQVVRFRSKFGSLVGCHPTYNKRSRSRGQTSRLQHDLTWAKIC